MHTLDQLYAQFQISAEEGDRLRRLADPGRHVHGETDRVVVETIIVEHGERRIVKTEERSAKLV